MKTLYESILSSTNSGKNNVIEKWCEDHIFDFKKGRFSISKDGRIDYYNTAGMPLYFVNIKSKEDFPEYIKFGDMSFTEFHVSEEGKFMTREQYPINCNKISFGKRIDSDNLDFLKKQRIVITANHLELGDGVKGIKSIFWTSNYDDISIKCKFSDFPLKDFKNVHLISTNGICTLDLRGSVAGTQFSKEITKIEKENEDIFVRQTKWKEFIDKTFPLIDGLTTIYFNIYNGSWVPYEFKNVDSKRLTLYKM